MAVDFAITCSLVRPGRPRYPVLVHRAAVLLHASFRPRLATTPLRFANPSPPSGWVKDFNLQAVDHARHTRKSPAGAGQGTKVKAHPLYIARAAVAYPGDYPCGKQADRTGPPSRYPIISRTSYPWCSRSSDRSSNINCYFTSKEQCQRTTSGIGAMCFPSPYYRQLPGVRGQAVNPRRPR
jgi:hypothetical protein